MKTSTPKYVSFYRDFPGCLLIEGSAGYSNSGKMVWGIIRANLNKSVPYPKAFLGDDKAWSNPEKNHAQFVVNRFAENII